MRAANRAISSCMLQLCKLRHTHTSVDPAEATKFAKLSATWWDPSGPFAPLHSLNPARCRFIREAVCSALGKPAEQREPFTNLHVLDVGCGGGLLAESIARLGASVHAIDLTSENISAAQQHAKQDPVISSRIRYQVVQAEELAQQGSTYDVVIASEVIEHVKSVDSFVRTLASLMKDDGCMVLSTLNRSVASYLVAILGAEYIAGAVPQGTHDWARFLTPQEIAMLGANSGLHLENLAGMVMNPVTGKWSLSSNTTVNYIALLRKRIDMD